MTVPPSSVSIVALLGEKLQHIAGALVGLAAEEIVHFVAQQESPKISINQAIVLANRLMM